MTATTTSQRISIGSDVVRDAEATVRATPEARNATLVLRLATGEEAHLPISVQRTLIQTLNAIATGGSVTIGQTPEQLTSTVAADILGVSRPTLMKWAREGLIESFKVGSHARFRRNDVMRLREQRVAERRAAFNELRAFDAEHDDLLDD